ncbi:MAG: membrane dipeptidase [Bacteroidetes bacterium]|nr:membrane dipeptidase [Bacteroidota bacterium]
MKNILKLSVSFITLILLTLSACNNPKTDEEIKELALKIHESALVIDTHNDTPMRFTRSEFNMGERHDYRDGGGRVDFPRMKEGGLDGAFFAVFTGQGARDDEGNQKAYNRAIGIFNAIDKTIEKHQDIAGLALSPDDAYALEKEGKRAVFIGMENGYPVGNDLKKVEEFYNRGTRYITLVHTRNNDICDSSTDDRKPKYGGLSQFGEQVVDEMNRLGIMVDVSHASDESFYDIIERSKAPIMASHSSVRALSDSPRNLDDEMLKALAENGGVIQICILSSYIKQFPNPQRDSASAVIEEKLKLLTDNDSVARVELYREMRSLRRKYPSERANVQDACDHIDYVTNLIGVDHVGIGTDFDGGGAIEGCDDVSEMPNITIELVKRGYSKKEISKIWGGNVMRVLTEVEKVAASM